MDRPTGRRATVVRLFMGTAVVLMLIGFGTGCATSRPRSFAGVGSEAPITRARAITLGTHLPDSAVVPRLLGLLNDDDPVVRMTAHDELRRRSGQDFGYLPWASPEERDEAITRWSGWWQQQASALTSQTVAPGRRGPARPRGRVRFQSPGQPRRDRQMGMGSRWSPHGS